MSNSSQEAEFNHSILSGFNRYTAHKLEGVATFTSLKGFRTNAVPSSKEVRISIHLESAEDSVPSAAQINSYQYLKENEAQITSALLAGLYKDYPQIREVYGGIEPEYLPEAAQPEDLLRAINPVNIHINPEEKNDFAYIGFECDCLWDPEHGLGIMMHLDEYVGCNDAEAAWNLELALS